MSEPIKEYFPTVYPFVDRAKLYTRGCGIASDRIESLPWVPRIPFQLIWASSPDRGLDDTITVFRMAREQEPRLSLHIHYGWQGVEVAASKMPDSPLATLKERCFSGDQTNIIWHDRTSKTALLESYQRSGIWCYCSTAPETGCVTAQEAQALGCIPVFNPIWALKDKVRNGIAIVGEPSNPATLERYRDAILWLVKHPESADEIREQMIPTALQEFDWELSIDLHEQLVASVEPPTPQAVLIRKNQGVNASRRLVMS
jgi:glycosyltransferase involved in cell wall biosynthesis